MPWLSVWSKTTSQFCLQCLLKSVWFTVASVFNSAEFLACTLQRSFGLTVALKMLLVREGGIYVQETPSAERIRPMALKLLGLCVALRTHIIRVDSIFADSLYNGRGTKFLRKSMPYGRKERLPLCPPNINIPNPVRIKPETLFSFSKSLHRQQQGPTHK